MNKLVNAFSWFNFDVKDSQDDTGTHSETETVNGKGKAKEKDDSSEEVTTPIHVNGNCTNCDKAKEKDDSLEEVTTPKHENGTEKLPLVSGEYKLPLAWIDLEMTGLNIEVDRILEIACVITDGNLTKSIEGPDLVIHQTKECMDSMGEWCQSHHAASGLTKKVLNSSITEEEAEKQVIEFVKRNISTYTPLLAGNSVYMDLLFLKKFMPNLASMFSHVLVDVSSVKALCLRWYPRENRKAPQKLNNHRAMDDIKESIAELKYYKEHIFKAKPRK